MPTNDFIGFAAAGSANVMSQADYAAAAEQTDGVQPGPASSALANKVWRQGANMASAIGDAIVDFGYDALDNGDIAALKNSFKNAFITKTESPTSWAVCKAPTGWMCESTTQSLTVNSSGLVTVTFTQAFVGDQPQIAILGRSSAHIYRIQGLSLTSVTLQVYNMNGSTVTSGTTQFCLTAVGRWS